MGRAGTIMLDQKVLVSLFFCSGVLRSTKIFLCSRPFFVLSNFDVCVLISCRCAAWFCLQLFSNGKYLLFGMWTSFGYCQSFGMEWATFVWDKLWRFVTTPPRGLTVQGRNAAGIHAIICFNSVSDYSAPSFLSGLSQHDLLLFLLISLS